VETRQAPPVPTAVNRKIEPSSLEGTGRNILLGRILVLALRWLRGSEHRYREKNGAEKTMDTHDFITTFVVDQTPREVFNAVNHVRGWWSENIEGSTDSLNDEFLYQYQDAHHCKIKVVEVLPDKKVVWLVTYNYFNFVQDPSEWTGTKVHFDIAQQGDKTQLLFTHEGLVPTFECYSVYSPAWTNYVQQSLSSLITTGKGHPNQKESDPVRP
jgi:hypothetical protein